MLCNSGLLFPACHHLRRLTNLRKPNMRTPSSADLVTCLHLTHAIWTAGAFTALLPRLRNVIPRSGDSHASSRPASTISVTATTVATASVA
ncbi:MAG TPA: hypothetical protein VFX16_09740 [Pseudonocardiaceae bacterium]|nr:hypothetical protein [Pseudonocardiaceae bacterium]